MSISANKREDSNFSNERKVGLFKGKVVEFNKELDSDGKEINYSGKSQDGNNTYRVAVTLADEATGEHYPLSIFLEDKEVVSKTGKTQFINEQGRAMYAEKADLLPEKFAASSVHKAMKGEEQLLNFLDAFLNIDRNKNYTMTVDCKKIINGNTKELTDLLKTDLPRSILAMATVKTVEKDGVTKHYQRVYDKKFLPGYTLSNFVAANLDDDGLATLRTRNQAAIENRKGYLKPWEKYAIEVTDPGFGIKDAYSLKPIHTYNPEEHVALGGAVLDETEVGY